VRISGGERYASVYNIDYNRCIFCGYCEEACPTYAIQLIPDFEMAEYNRQNLVFEKEDLLMRDLYASSVSYINATGGVNGLQPSEITRNDINNIERLLLGNDARTMLQVIEAENKFSTGPTRDAFIALASTDITSDLQNVQGVLLKNAYPDQNGLRPEEYCSVSRFRFFVSSKAAKIPGAASNGSTVYTVPMYGLEAAAKVEQNNYTAVLGYRPPYVVSSVAQNSQLYAKFAIGRAITNQNWISGLNVTARL
jgi:N4-gp56 family major capsid protein